MRKTVVFLTMMLLLSSAVPAAVGQSMENLGTVSGVVEDGTSAVVPNAIVELKSVASDFRQRAVSGGDGGFEIARVPFGDYVIKVTADGFDNKVAKLNVKTAVASINVALHIAQVHQEVSVSATAAASAERNLDAAEFDSGLLNSLPTPDADPLSLAARFQDPGAAAAAGSSVVVDGVETDGAELPGIAVKRLFVNKNPYSAEFARPGGSRIEIQTETGSRTRIHKKLSYMTRDAALNARNPFALAKPEMRRQFIQGELDGPIRGDKLTFFAAADFLDNSEAAVVNAVTPDGNVTGTVTLPEKKFRFIGRVDARLSPTHTVGLQYRLKESSADRGVGGFNLRERGTRISASEYVFRVSDSLALSPSLSNELRVAAKFERDATRSVDSGTAVVVVDAFSRGGAQVNTRQRETSFEVQDTITWSKGSHTLRVGGAIKPRFFNVSDASNFGGTFFFSSLADFEAGRPYLFRINQGNPAASFTQIETMYFAQDDIRLRPDLELLLGFRHQLQSNSPDHNNLAPRFAVAWAPGNGTTVLRLGAGVFYDHEPAVMQQSALLLDGVRTREFVLANPPYPALDSAALAAAAPSAYRISPRIRTPYFIQSSLGVEHQFSRNNSISAGYTIGRGLKLYRLRNVNAPLPPTGDRPDNRFLNVNQFESTGSSGAHSFNVSVRSRPTRRLELLAAYTLSWNHNDTSGLFSLPADNYDLRGEWGRADFDRRHRVNVAASLRLPAAMKLGLVASFSSAAPYNVTTGTDTNGDTVANDRPAGIGRNTGQGFGFAEVDVRIVKKWKLWTESRTGSNRDLEFRLDAFNVLNHSNYSNVVGTMTSPFFGRANAALPGRTLQVGTSFKF